MPRPTTPDALGALANNPWYAGPPGIQRTAMDFAEQLGAYIQTNFPAVYAQLVNPGQQAPIGMGSPAPSWDAGGRQQSPFRRQPGERIGNGANVGGGGDQAYAQAQQNALDRMTSMIPQTPASPPGAGQSWDSMGGQGFARPQPPPRPAAPAPKPTAGVAAPGTMANSGGERRGGGSAIRRFMQGPSSGGSGPFAQKPRSLNEF